jgi:hypothetical protein
VSLVIKYDMEGCPVSLVINYVMGGLLVTNFNKIREGGMAVKKWFSRLGLWRTTLLYDVGKNLSFLYLQLYYIS